MTIEADLREALEIELEKRRAGKRPKSTTAWRMGNSAYVALCASLKEAEPTMFASIPIERTDTFDGWELRS